MKNSFVVPLAIVFAGMLIGGTIYVSKHKPSSEHVVVGGQTAVPNPKNETLVPPTVFTLKADDHILGNPSAPVRIIEYSDFECPFCRRFHYTMEQIIDEYGKTGEVAWVYRHFPIDSIHPKAREEARAAECATDIGGAGAFWKYMDRVITITPSNNGLDLALLPDIAKYIGIDVDKWNICMASDKFKDRVERDFEEGVDAGIAGTPYAFAIQRDGRMEKIAGSYPYANMKVILDALLTAQPGTANTSIAPKI